MPWTVGLLIGLVIWLLLCTGSPSDRLFAYLAVGNGYLDGRLQLDERALSFTPTSRCASGSRRITAVALSRLHRANQRLVPFVFSFLGLAILGLSFWLLHQKEQGSPVSGLDPGERAYRRGLDFLGPPWICKGCVWIALVCLLLPRLIIPDPTLLIDLFSIASVAVVCAIFRRPAAWVRAPLLFAVWPLLAPGVGFGLALLLAASVGAALDRWKDGQDNRLLRATLQSLVSSAIVSGLVLILGTGTTSCELWGQWKGSLMPDAAGLDPQDAPIDLWSGQGRLLVALVLLAVSCLVLSRAVNNALVVPWLVLVWSGFQSQRWIGPLAVTSVVLIMSHLGGILSCFSLSRNRTPPTDRWARRTIALLSILARFCPILLAIVALSLCPPRSGKALLAEPSRADHPAKGAFSALLARPDNPRLIVPYSWSGRSLYELAARYPSFFDCREGSHAPDVAARYREVFELWDGCDSVLESSRIDLVLTGARGALTQILETSPGWTVAYFDRTCCLFERKKPGDHPARASTSSSKTSTSQIGVLVRTSVDALERGNPWRAVYSAERAIEAAPQDPRLRMLLGRILLGFGDRDRALRVFADAAALPGGGAFTQEIEGLLRAKLPRGEVDRR